MDMEIDGKPMLTYKRYMLSCNPFHPAGLPTEQEIIWAARYELRKKLENILARIMRSGRSEYVVINGDYGSGKSHTLLHFGRRINSGEFGKQVISVYIKNPGRGLIDFYRCLISTFGLPRINDLAKELIGRTLSKCRPHGDFESDHTAQSEILGKYRRLLSAEYLSSRIAKSYSLGPDFASALTFLGLETNVEIVWKWLTASRLGPHEMHKINVLNMLDSVERLEEAFCYVIKLLRGCGYKVIYLLLDEVEDLLNIKDETKRMEYLRSIRRLIDYNPMGIGLFLACTEDGWREILLNYQPLASRLARGNFLQLFNLTYDETKQFIMDYLLPYRVQDSTAAEFPFEESSIKLIHEYSNGIPREIVKACALSIENAFSKGSRTVTEVLAREALASG